MKKILIKTLANSFVVWYTYYSKKDKERRKTMTTQLTVNSTVKASKGNKVIYLTAHDEERGLDIALDMQGYTLEAL